MSVFTPVSESSLEQLLLHFDIGIKVELQPISQGMENTNYFLTTRLANAEKQWVLTLFETLQSKQLGYFLGLLESLSACGVPVPAPVKDIHGQVLHSCMGKPAIIVPRLSGAHVEQPEPRHCHQLGIILAKIHNTPMAKAASPTEPDSRLWTQLLPSLSQGFSNSQLQLLDDTLQEFKTKTSPLQSKLNTSLIHGDLFRDNVLFEGNTLSGVIDFYNAREDISIYDLAIAANDWCRDASLHMDSGKLAGLVSGYNSIRPLSEQEKALSNSYLQLAALRFWLSRTKASQVVSSSPLVQHKDPVEYEKILAITRKHPEENCIT